MKNNRHYLLIIGLLGIAFISLIVGVLVSKNPDLTVNASTPSNGVAQYSKFRQGRLVADEFIRLENCIGGSENDCAVSLVCYGDKTFVFGNSDSLDYDLDGCDGRAFVVVLSRDLAVEGVKFLGNGEKIAHATLIEGGFIVCFEDDGKIFLRKYSFDLLLRNSTRADNGGKFYFEDMRYIGDKLYLMMRQSISATRYRLVLHTYDDALSLCYERVISSPYSLDLIDYFVIGGSVSIFVNCSSDLGQRLAVARTNDSASVSITYLTDSANSIFSSVMPLENGYFLSFCDGENTGFLALDSNFSVVKLQNLANGTGSMLGYSDGIYYFFSSSESGGCAFAISPDLGTVRQLDYLDGISKFYGFTALNYGALFYFERNGKTTIAGSENSFRTTLPPCDDFLICPYGGAYFIALNLAHDSPYSFGKTDIVIYRMDL